MNSSLDSDIFLNRFSFFFFSIITFWWKKYTINDNNIPKFLEPLKTKILLTGKYLNAIHETGKFLVVDSNELAIEDAMLADDDEGLKRTSSGERLRLTASKKLVIPNAVEINFTTKEDVYKNIVDNAYNYSSEVLLNLLLKEHKLMDRLRFSLIQFFFEYKNSKSYFQIFLN